MFSTNKRRSSRFISFKGSGTQISLKMITLVLELGCGKENIQLVLPKDIPIKISLELILKELVFWRGAKTAVDEGLHNVAFIRTQIELINHILPKMKWMKSGFSRSSNKIQTYQT
jgi:hypothetical protein